MNFNSENLQAEYFGGGGGGVGFFFVFNDFIYLNKIPFEAFQGNSGQFGRKNRPPHPTQPAAGFA